MKVFWIIVALAAVAATDSYERTQLFRTHVPYYNFDWVVKDDYNDYGQVETRDGGYTKTNWGVTLPGYSHIKREESVNAQQVHHSYYPQGYESKPVYKNEYKPIQFKEGYKPVDNNAGYTPAQNKEAYNNPIHRSEYKPFVHFKEESTKPVYKTEYKPTQYREEYKPVGNAGYKTEWNKRNYKF